MRSAKLRAARYFALGAGFDGARDLIYSSVSSIKLRIGRMIKVAMKKRLHEVVHGKNPKKDVPLAVSDCANYVRPILPPKEKWN